MLLMLKWHWPQVSKNMCYVFSLQLTTLDSCSRPIDFKSSSCLPESGGIWFHHDYDGTFFILFLVDMVLITSNGSSESSGCLYLICEIDIYNSMNDRHILMTC